MTITKIKAALLLHIKIQESFILTSAIQPYPEEVKYQSFKAFKLTQHTRIETQSQKSRQIP